MAEPMLKNKIQCPCEDESCTVFGTPKKSGHVIKCKCRRCQGGRNRSSGIRKQRAFQKAAGIREAAFRGANGNEESWRDAFAWEHKADARHAKPVVTSYRLMRAQIESNRSIGDPRPAACGVTYDGLQLVIVDAETWRTVVAPLLEGL